MKHIYHIQKQTSTKYRNTHLPHLEMYIYHIQKYTSTTSRNTHLPNLEIHTYHIQKYTSPHLEIHIKCARPAASHIQLPAGKSLTANRVYILYSKVDRAQCPLCSRQFTSHTLHYALCILCTCQTSILGFNSTIIRFPCPVLLPMILPRVSIG